TVAVAVVISGVVALTLTPALCAIILKAVHGESKFFRPFNRGFERLTNFYTSVVGLTLRHRIIGAIAFAGIIAIAVFMLRLVPSSFVPPEDQGYVISAIMLPDGATLNRTSKTTEAVRAAIDQHPA